MSSLKCSPPFNSFFHIRLYRKLLSFISFLWIFRSLSFFPLTFLLFLLFSLFHRPFQTDNRLPVFFHGLLSKRACLLSPIFLSQPSLFSHGFTSIPFFHYSRRKSHSYNMPMKFLFFKNQFSSSFSTTVYWHVIVTPPSRPLTLLQHCPCAKSLVKPGFTRVQGLVEPTRLFWF